MSEPGTGPAADGRSGSVFAAIRAAVESVYRDTARPVRGCEEKSLLGADLGLDSLDMAQVVVLLERSLGVDPFRDHARTAAAGPVRTVADLVSIYSAALAPAAEPRS